MDPDGTSKQLHLITMKVEKMERKEFAKKLSLEKRSMGRKENEKKVKAMKEAKQEARQKNQVMKWVWHFPILSCFNLTGISISSEYAREELYKSSGFSYDMLEQAMEIEHEANQRSLLKYTHSEVKVTKHSQGEYSYLYTNSAFPPNGFDNLSIIISEENCVEGLIVRGKIRSVDSRIIYFSHSAELDPAKSYIVKYEKDRWLTDACIRAIQSVRLEVLEYFLTFTDETVDMKKKRNIKAPTKWFNPKIAQDAKQKEAVAKIITESVYPFPFVVCGGPGVGKTSVMVEAACQILEKKSFANILITCQSNSACDEVGIRLRNFLPALKVFRYFAPAKALKKTSNKDNYFEKLRVNSSINERGRYVGSVKENLMKYKIVISTMSVANRMINDGIPNDHFDFIFIDECCAAIEPECLIPIVGLGMGFKKINANIVLIGDVQLLGPVLNSPRAKSLGLGELLLRN